MYLVFSKTGTLLSILIRKMLKSKYAHVSISLDESMKTLYSFGRIKPKNPFWGGFVEESFSGGVFKRFKNSECRIHKIKISKEQYEVLSKELDRFLEEPRSYKYSFWGVIAAGFKIPIRISKHYFCSQFVTELLRKTKVIDEKFVPELTTPIDLMEVGPKEVLYEGYIREYALRQTAEDESYSQNQQLCTSEV